MSDTNFERELKGLLYLSREEFLSIIAIDLANESIVVKALDV